MEETQTRKEIAAKPTRFQRPTTVSESITLNFYNLTEEGKKVRRRGRGGTGRESHPYPSPSEATGGIGVKEKKSARNPEQYREVKSQKSFHMLCFDHPEAR